MKKFVLITVAIFLMLTLLAGCRKSQAELPVDAEPTAEPTAEPETTVNPDAQYAIVKEEVTVLCEINGSMKIRTADIGDCFEVIEIVNNTVTVKFEGGIGFIALDSVEIADSPAEAAKVAKSMTTEAEPAAAEEAAAEVSEPAEPSAAPAEGAAEEAA